MGVKGNDGAIQKFLDDGRLQIQDGCHRDHFISAVTLLECLFKIVRGHSRSR